MKYELRDCGEERSELVRIEDDGSESCLGEDRGEPEDNLFCRDWKWVPLELNTLAAECSALRARCARLRAALAGVVESAVRWIGPPGGIPRSLELERLLALPKDEIMSVLPFRVTLAALEVLRETAGEGVA